jgi:ABC-type polysaccharide/polyol phosphate export permease
MLKTRIKKIYSCRRILWDMTVKQLKVKYAGSRLGIWWAIVTPLLLAASINFVFNKVFKIEIPNYTFFVLAGLIPWFFFAGSLGEAAGGFIVHSAVVRQAVFPREFIAASSVSANLLNFLIGLVFLLPLFVILNPGVLALLPFLILAVVLNFIFVLGLGLLFSCVNVFFRDLEHFLAIGFMIWFWVTPIFYPLKDLSFPFRWVCILNPMTYYVLLYQDILFCGQAPSLLKIFAATSVSLLSFILGYGIFLKKEPALLKRI